MGREGGGGGLEETKNSGGCGRGRGGGTQLQLLHAELAAVARIVPHVPVAAWGRMSASSREQLRLHLLFNALPSNSSDHVKRHLAAAPAAATVGDGAGEQQLREASVSSSSSSSSDGCGWRRMENSCICRYGRKQEGCNARLFQGGKGGRGGGVRV